MATRLRLQRHGAKGAPFYKIVAADARARRDGRYIDQIGTYNPTSIPATIILDVDKAVKWLQTGAEPTETVKAILSYKGALYKKHLLRGVQLGFVKAEDVETKFNEWVANKEGKVIDHKTKADQAKKAKIDAAVKTPAKVKEVVVEEAAPEAEVTETPVAEATVEAAAEPVAEAVAEPVAEAAAEPVAEVTETPEAESKETPAE
jgi:small subunit ribosomal protein S16